MSTPLITRYPLDPTGTSPNNLVVGEAHTLDVRRVRAVATSYGAFFTESLQITDMATNTPLTSSQYYAAELYELPSARYGKEICAIIMITDPTVSSNISLTYQALGGEFSNSMTAIIQQIDNLNLDDRPVAWPDVVDRPSEYTPSHHLHDIGDVYGFEYVVHAIDRMRAAILLGDSYSHNAIYQYVDRADAVLQSEINQGNQSFQAHLQDYNNPHRVTRDQLDVYSRAEVDAKDSAVATTAQTNLQAHTNNLNNPHQVTAAQLNCYTKPDVDALINQTANTAQSNLQAHESNYSNPHNVTRDQLDVYSREEVDSKDNTVATNAANALNAHESNYSNPHQVTAVQVGLGNVQNYGIASDADAQAGTSNTAYMTPYLVNERVVEHANSGDHDARYVMKATAQDTSLQVVNGQLQAFVAGAWQIVWPPQWQ